MSSNPPDLDDLLAPPATIDTSAISTPTTATPIRDVLAAMRRLQDSWPMLLVNPADLDRVTEAARAQPLNVQASEHVEPGAAIWMAPAALDLDDLGTTSHVLPVLLRGAPTE